MEESERVPKGRTGEEGRDKRVSLFLFQWTIWQKDKQRKNVPEVIFDPITAVLSDPNPNILTRAFANPHRHRYKGEGPPRDDRGLIPDANLITLAQAFENFRLC